MPEPQACDYMTHTTGETCGRTAKWTTRDFDARIRFLCGIHARVWDRRNLGAKTKKLA